MSERRMLRFFGSSIPKVNGGRASVSSREQMRHTVYCGKNEKKKKKEIETLTKE